MTATLREEGAHTARLHLGERVYRVLYDVTEAVLRVELEGRAYRFDSQSAGQVRAAAPAMVVAVHVKPGDTVLAGQPIGLLEAMKMEVAFEAPVSGIVTEVRVRRGEQVAAGDVLLVIEPKSEESAAQTVTSARLLLPELSDPLEPLFREQGSERLGAPDLLAAESVAPAVRRAAITAVRDETRRALLGYDLSPARAEQLAEFLEAALPEQLSESFCSELADVRQELILLCRRGAPVHPLARGLGLGRARPLERRTAAHVRAARARGRRRLRRGVPRARARSAPPLRRREPRALGRPRARGACACSPPSSTPSSATGCCAPCCADSPRSRGAASPGRRRAARGRARRSRPACAACCSTRSPTPPSRRAT